MPFSIGNVKIYMEVYGCAANQGDASIMKGILLSRGHEIVDEVEKAEVAIIVTCTVIDTTQQRMLHRINVLKKKVPKLMVAGCMASAQPDLVRKAAGDAILLPPKYIHHVEDALNNMPHVFRDAPKTGFPRKFDLKMNIPISDGCLYNCSYCITKRARGQLISYPMEELVEDVKRALRNGSMEIRLTAQDTASYIHNGNNLADLIREVSSIDGRFRIRVGMMHPLSAIKILDELLEAYENEKVYKFLHLPLQSASPRILKAMRRGYDIDMFREIVKEFRKKFHDFTLATDIIVAFPGESDDDFEMSLNAIEEIKPDVVNITRFSPRPGTDAWKMKRMDTKVAKERSRIMAEVANKISMERNRRKIGKEYEVLILEKYKGSYVGKTDSYTSVFVDRAEIGEFFKVRILDASTTHLHGILTEEIVEPILE